MSLSVMSFNVRGSFHDDGENDWHKRRDLNIKTIQRHSPDILGVQEAQSGNLKDYADFLEDYIVEEGLISIRQTDRFHRVPIYYKYKQFEKIDSGGFYLSDSPDEWSTCWGSDMARAATWIHLRHIAGGQDLFVLNTHFPHERENHWARTQSAKLLIQRVEEMFGLMPGIVMGDFNSLPDSEAYNVFLTEGYCDSYREAGHNKEVGTFHGFQGDATEWTGRLDWILTHNSAEILKVYSCEVIKANEHPIYPSDHYPVLTHFDWI